MPRHFLVKRHKPCVTTQSYRDRLYEGQDVGVSGRFTGSSGSTTTIIDTDKQVIIRDGEGISDYSGYNSPDSGYAASPNSAQIGFAREKENIGSDRDNNNFKRINKVNNINSFYDSSYVTIPTSNIINNNNNSSSSIDFAPTDHMMETCDGPIDLSMPSRKKNVLSSVPSYLQQENHHTKHEQPFHVYHCPPSSGQAVCPPAAAAAVLYFNSFNKFCLSEKTDRSLCAALPPLSPSHSAPYTTPLPLALTGHDARMNALYPGAVKAEISNLALQAELLSRGQCIAVPTAALTHTTFPSSLSSSLSSPPAATTAAEMAFTTGPTTPLKTPSPQPSPSRKRLMPEDSEDDSEHWVPHDLSKSAPVLKKGDAISANATTPTSKIATSVSQKAKTTVAPAKKSHSSAPNGKKLKAVRRLNFDIDTTSPVSGTIIKDAADFHPEEGKVVYGDIEPSFNFVEVTPEARAELEKIENKLGDYICQLCKEFYEDAFQLAQHRCSRIVHVEYRCPECEKVFNCPANLASHRRWHKPRANSQSKQANNSSSKVSTAQPKILPRPDYNSNRDKGVAATTANIVMSLPTTGSSLTTNACEPRNIENTRNHQQTNDANRGSQVNHTNKHNSDNSYQDVQRMSSPEADVADLTNKFVDDSISPPVSRPSRPEDSIGRMTSSPFSSAITTDHGSPGDKPTAVSDASASEASCTTTTIGSSLTPEERSLVLQVLSSHNRHQHQTTTITSTTTVMTPLVSDSHCNIPNMNSQNPVHQTELSHPQVTAASRLDHSPGPDHISNQHSTSPPPLDLTNTSDRSHRSPSPSLPPPPPLLLRLPQPPPPQPQQQHRTSVMSDYTANPQIECPVCGKRFQRQAYLRKHIQNQHKRHYEGQSMDGLSENGMVKENTFSCPQKSIGSNYATPVDVSSLNEQRHMNSCAVCGKSFTSESARLKHEAMTHGLTLNLTCGTCGMTFTSKTALDKHSRSAHVAEIFSCKYCSSTFHSSPGLTRHINKCHPTENRQVILLQLPGSRTC